MNFLELINRCLLELNYKPVNSFSELVKNDHTKIKNILNIVNQEICKIENWNFLLRRTNIEISANTNEIENPIKGRILYLFINNQEYKYTENINKFLIQKPFDCTYSILNNKILLPKIEKNTTAQIIYYSDNCVIDENGNEKEILEFESDESLIPMPFAQQLLVFGTCLRLKANPQYIRFNYWMSMYKEALSNLKSKISVYSKDAPIVRLRRF